MEHNRHVAFGQLARHGEHLAVRQTHVQNGGVERAIGNLKPLGDGRGGGNARPLVLKQELQIEQDQELVFHQQNRASLKRGGQRRFSEHGSNSSIAATIRQASNCEAS